MSETRTLELLRTLGDQFAGLTGEVFFQQLVREIARRFGVRCAFASKFDPANNSATVLGLWADGPFARFAADSLEGAPGEWVSHGGVAVFRHGVEQRVSRHSAWFEQHGIQSYLAAPVRAGNGVVGGQLAVMDTADRDWSDADVDMLRLFALRAGGALELAAWQERARHSNEALGNIGHELRTPLNGILGYAQLLLRDPTMSPPQRESIVAIRGAGERLLKQLEALRDMAQIGELQFEPPRKISPDNPSAATSAASAAQGIVGYAGKRLRLLIADDDQQSRDLLAKTLAPLGFECLQTSDGADAIDALQCAQFDMIVTDLNMPRVDGFGVLQAARAQQPQRPVLAVSANTAHDGHQRAIAAGFTDFIAKPWALEPLLQSVGASLGVKWVYRATPAADAARAQRATPDQRDLDPALLASLHHHAKAGDVTALLQALDRVCGPAGNHPLADELRRLTRQYDLKSVRNILEPLAGASTGAAAGRQ